MNRSSLIKIIIRANSSVNNLSLNIPNEIKIPNKIYRDDCTVLKALTSCVQNEKGLPEFAVIDDPFTLPKDYLMRKKFLLSKASGKLSAKMAFLEMKNEFIKVAHDEPPVKSLMPLIDARDVEAAVLSGKSSVETGLKQLVNLLSPKDAWSFYESHKESTFSEAVIQSLLELLCATGSTSYSMDTPLEDVYFSQQVPTEWRLDNPAELLFHSLELKTHKAYCAMIRGASKHNNPTRAIELLREMRIQYPQVFLDLTCVNNLFRSLNSTDLDDNTVKELIIDLLRNMAHFKIAPTAHTFNNAIFAFCNRSPIEFAESLYHEMLGAEIEPTLGTYSILLQCNFDRSLQVALVKDVVEILEERRAKVDYEETTSFDDRTLFTTAMALLRRGNRLDLALRLNKVVDSGGRFHMFANEAYRGKYFDCFFKLMLKAHHDLDEVLNLIRRYVPNCYVLQPTTVNNLIDQINLSRQTRLLPVLLDVVNWNNKRNIETDSFPRILEQLRKAVAAPSDDVSNSDLLRQRACQSLTKVFENTRTRESSVLTMGNNLEAAIEVSRLLGDGGALLWSLIGYGKERGILGVATAASIAMDSFGRKEFEKVAGVWRYLAEGGGALLRGREQREALRGLLAVTEAEVLPTMTRFAIEVGEMRAHVQVCRQRLAVEARGHDDEDLASSSSSSSSSSSDSDSDSDQ